MMFRIKALMIAMALLVSGMARGADMQQAQEAWAAFTDGRYNEAVKIYEKLAEQAPGNPELLYNLGTAYARAGQRGLAIWRYLQALRLDPRDRELRHNLQVLDPGIFEDIAITPIPPINWIYERFTANEWAVAAGTLATLAMLMGTLYFWGLHRSRMAVRLSRATLGLFLMAAVVYPFAFMHYHLEDNAWRGVVVSEKTVARAGPSTNQTETDDLPVGTVLRLVESQGDWYKFSYRGGRMGFVEKSRIRRL